MQISNLPESLLSNQLKKKTFVYMILSGLHTAHQGSDKNSCEHWTRAQ